MDQEKILEFLKNKDFLRSFGFDENEYYTNPDDEANVVSTKRDIGRGQIVCNIPAHGADNIVWKCMFCCRKSVLVEFVCGGHDNYCGPCHMQPGTITNCDPNDCIFDGNHPPDLPKNVRTKKYSMGCSACQNEIDYSTTFGLVNRINNAKLLDEMYTASTKFITAASAAARIQMQREQPSDGSDRQVDSHIAKYVQHFLRQDEKEWDHRHFSMGHHVYILVHFYSWLQRTMAYKFSYTDLLSLKVVDAINMLSPRMRDYGLRLLRKFIKAWNEMREHWITFLTCDEARELEAGIDMLEMEEIQLHQLLLSKDFVKEDLLIYRMLDGRLVSRYNLIVHF